MVGPRRDMTNPSAHTGESTQERGRDVEKEEREENVPLSLRCHVSVLGAIKPGWM